MSANLSQRMQLGQHMSQQMKLSPRMIQSMEILQMPLTELEERVDQELEDNVVLIDSTQDGEAGEGEREGEGEGETVEELPQDVDQQELVVDSEDSNTQDFERLVEMYSEWPQDNVTSASRVSVNRTQDAADRHQDVMVNMVSRGPSLHEYLLEQWRLFELDEPLREFGEYLIQNLDRNGRLQSTLAEVVQVYGRSISTEESIEVLERVQQLDPRGVGARDIRECLLLQLTDTTSLGDVLHTLISNHLEDLKENRMPVIQRKTGYSIELIKAARQALTQLDPFPGRRFQYDITQPVKADLRVEQAEDGNWQVQVEDERVPQLRISRHYIEMLQRGVDTQTRDYLKKRVEAARWLIESIEQRSNTVKHVAQAIVDYQKAFLEEGPEAITPLKMQQVADVVGVHVTTVSRAVDGKWLQTPRGLFPLRSFFGGGTKTSDGDDVAWEIIQLKLQEVVDNEDKSRPLSDDALVTALADHGFQLARRTVTKYRKKLGIPSSRQRREY